MNDNLESIIKKFEKETEYKIPYNEFMIIRIDGHKFSKFTKVFKKPFDMLLSETMEHTAKDLVERFGAVLGYHQSDEITMVIPPIYSVVGEEIKNEQIFNGRTQKICSLVASYTSIRFNHWLKIGFDALSFKESVEMYSDDIENRIGLAWFDARVFGVPTKELAYKVILWRSQDAIINSKSMFAQAYCPHKTLLNKNSNEQIKLCLEQTGNDWNLIDDRFKYGLLVKKESYIKDTEYGEIQRTRVVSFSKNDLRKMSDENINLIVRKYLNEI